MKPFTPPPLSIFRVKPFLARLRGALMATLACATVASVASGQSLPLEIRLQQTTINYLSPSGVPISSNPEDPGSDGRLPTGDEVDGRVTAGQFQGFVSFGGVVRTAGSGEYATYETYAQEVLPGASSGGQQIYLARAQVGAPYISRRVAFLFGSIVQAPTIDENGDELGVPSSAYWLREPYWPAAEIEDGVHIGAPYYWSRHAQAVFATRPGPITIAWRRAQPVPDVDPVDYANNPDFAVIAGRVYRLFRQSYLVSGSSMKPPRRMYWTEGSFSSSGLPVDVPEGVTVNFIYTANFPKTVDEAYEDPGASPPVPPGEGDVLTELRTIFYDPDRKSIRAYNWQGRILLELLGDVLEDDRRQHLGFEIIDVVRRVNPADIEVELGERLTAWEGGSPPDGHLVPRTLLRSTDNLFAFQHFAEGGRVQFYAIRETENLNDFLLHWTEEGVEGLRWPSRFTRYNMVWPDDISKYSHYIRPSVETEAEARETAVEMPLSNVPIIEYQDPLDQPRAKLTETFAFYTFLDEDYPAHRTLLRFMSGDHVAFERVFSWLGDSLESGDAGELHVSDTLADILGKPPVEGEPEPALPILAEWDPVAKVLRVGNALHTPRVIEAVARVGTRIEASADESIPEPGAGNWAGHIVQEKGISYNPLAYIDPFEAGFEAANQGAIIPVNAIPDANQLEVWWFRSNAPNLERGFSRIFWPSVIGRYTLDWPLNPREIVLASNDGSGGLGSLEAKGSIYTQNDSAGIGYNPNEEHALMTGGQAYALRDDLNITEAGQDFSSEPYVLLDYTDEDGRPNMTAFRVLREKPEEGHVFDYVVEAGTILQPPMPLGLLPPPVQGIGADAVNFNTEPEVAAGTGDLPVNWDEGSHGNGIFGHYPSFTFRDRKDSFWVYRGLHAGPPALAAGTYDPEEGIFQSPSPARVVAGELFRYVLHASERAEALRLEAADETPLPDWLTIRGLALEGTAPEVGQHQLTFVLSSIVDGSSIELPWTLDVIESGAVEVQSELEIVSENPYTGTQVTHIGRPPYLATHPAPENSFTMRFYYKTQAGFAWPGVENAPPVNAIVPYLRPVTPEGDFVGDAAAKETAALDIVYRPTWPVSTPGLRLGDTLLTAKEGLPAVRGQTSLQVLYQQSIAKDMAAQNVSVVLHDATREKEISLASAGLEKLPAGVRSEMFQGRVFFPNLPPHLVERFFFDPLRGTHGHLVFKGELREETLGADYLMLNVLRGEDLAAVKNLCPDGDLDKAAWDGAIDGLVATVETFHENPSVPGEFIPDEAQTVEVGIGDVVQINDQNTAVDSYALSASGPGTGYLTLIAGGGAAFTPEAEPVSIHIIRVEPTQFPGELKVIAPTNPLSEALTLQHSADLGGRFDEYEYEWRIAAPVDGLPPVVDAEMSQWLELADGSAMPRYTLGGADVRTLSDNYLIMRYRPINENHPLYVEDPSVLENPDDAWSPWTTPQLAEGWIKRVLAGINPFQQRVSDLFNNPVDTGVSMLTQAGPRWEGDVSLNLENIDDFGLIEIYETVLRRGKMLSINAGINYGPANDALLLAAGYLNDLYMFVGNEAWADAANPTIGIGTADETYGDIATSMFAFKGQVPTLLDEELALIRGRDDFLLPGSEVSPVYNRLVWNYTRGIDAGEVIYATNYNIQEKPDGEPTGNVSAEDAARMYPQGHGDAYGHYLTALKGYYGLLMNPNFDWVPRMEAVSVLGQPVSVDYFDERKFAAAAAAVARAGQLTFDLTWRRDYQSGDDAGWEHLAGTRTNAQTGRTRHWGMDHWATRTGQGTYLNWIVGNAMLPAEDPDPAHEGIQKIDRTTVQELTELPLVMDALQANLSNAEAGLTPLGLPEGSIAFDIDPELVVSGQTQTGRTHFEQIYDRALTALTNAVAAFDDAKDVTRLMRSEEDSLADFQTQLAQKEHAFKNALIELYGTAYPDDIGPGRTYRTGYDGPDLLHYMYVDLPGLPDDGQVQGTEKQTYELDIQELPDDWRTRLYTDVDFYQLQSDKFEVGGIDRPSPYILNEHFIEYELGPHGFFDKPETWTGKRGSPGQVQQAISDLIAAHHALAQSLDDAEQAQMDLEYEIRLFNSRVATDATIEDIERGLMISQDVVAAVNLVSDITHEILDALEAAAEDAANAAEAAVPTNFIAGLAAGGDVASVARGAIQAGSAVTKGTINAKKLAAKAIVQSLTLAQETTEKWVRFEQIDNLAEDQQLREQIGAIGLQISELGDHLPTIDQHLRALDDAERQYRALVAKGDRILKEREIFRRRSAAIVHGYRTRDAAFRIFRNEKLERYKTLFDLAARYTFLAAQAYDYETGLLHTAEGRDFIDRIVSARALGVVSAGEPQFGGSATGDPGLSSVLAEMMGDWSVVRGRLGFNNPDEYGTTVSLRRENYRVLLGEAGDDNWENILHSAWRENILDDDDIRRHAMQAGNDDFPVPGLIIPFSTTIASSRNLFGHPLAAGDHSFSPTSFATKIYAVGVALEGYVGMADPVANSSSVDYAEGESPDDPDAYWLDPNGLAATPYIYLIPVGADSMRSPPLGDSGTIRTWQVRDVTVPLPFNIGASQFSTLQWWQSGDFLTEEMFSVRKHQAFRPVSTASVFDFGSDLLTTSEFTNNRLIGRSVWNSEWKLVIPGDTLLADPDEGLRRFIETVRDIKLHFITYSYSGN